MVRVVYICNYIRCNLSLVYMLDVLSKKLRILCEINKKVNIYNNDVYLLSNLGVLCRLLARNSSSAPVYSAVFCIL